MNNKITALVLAFAIALCGIYTYAAEPKSPELPAQEQAKQEQTEYMRLMVELGLVESAQMQDAGRPVGDAFLTMMENSFFYRPDTRTENLTAAGGAAVIMVLLGYEQPVSSYGSYLTGGEIVGREVGLFRGISAKASEILKSGDAARMLYNAFEIPYLSANVISENYQLSKSDVCILDNLEIKKVTGVIKDTHYTSLNSNIRASYAVMEYTARNLLENGRYETVRGEDTFKIGMDNPEELLGKNLEAFVRDFENTKEVSAILVSEKNTTLEFENDEFMDYQSGRLTYQTEEESRKRTFEVSPTAALYVNGIRISRGQALVREDYTDPFTPYSGLYREYGGYRFLDNNSDGTYDCVFIEVYKDYVVGGIDRSAYRIDDKIEYTGYSFFLDPRINDFNVKYIRNTGEVTSFMDISKGDVISVRASKMDGKYVVWGTVMIVKGSVKGIITAIDSSGKKITINGRDTYPYIEIDRLRQDEFLFNLNDKGNFFVNFKGVVIMKDVKALPLTSYAFVDKYVFEDSIDKALKMRVLLANGEWEILSFATKVKWRDGGSHEQLTAEEFCEKYLRDAEGNLTNHTRTLITYTLDVDGKVAEISLPMLNITGKNDKGRLTIDRRYNQAELSQNLPQLDQSFTYSAKTESIGDAYLIERTIIFDVTLRPGESIENITLSSDNIQVVDISRIPDGTTPVITLFDMGDGNVCMAAITENLSCTFNSSDRLLFITNIHQVLSDGEAYTTVTGFENGEIKKLLVAWDARIEAIPGIGISQDASVQWGDVISYQIQSDGKLKVARVVFRAQKAQYYLPDIYGDGSFYLSNVNFYTDGSKPGEEVRYYYGLVAEKYESEFEKFRKLTLAKNDSPYPTELEEKLLFTAILALDENTIFYRYDAQNSNRPISRCYFSDIVAGSTRDSSRRTGDLAFVKTVGGIATEVVLIAP